MDFYDEKAKQWGVSRDEAKRRFLNMAYSAKPEELRKAAKTEFEDAIAFLVRSEIEHQQPGPLASGFHGRWENLSLEDCKFLYSVGIEVDI
jgi:hypothetical protein